MDVKFATKEVLRDAGEPRADAWVRLKRLGRYLLKAPRYILVFRWQKPTSKIKVTVDASHAGCVRTRKSTTCVVVRLGNHMIQDLSETQGTIRLSSGEAEYAGLVRGSQEGIYVKNLLRFFGRSAEVELESDSSSALGTVRRLGPGKRLRHVETEYFFLQALVREGIIKVTKVKGEDNVADLGTKHLAWPRMQHLLRMLSVRIIAASGVVLVPGATATSAKSTAVVKVVDRTAVVQFMRNDYLYVTLAALATLLVIVLACAWGLKRLRKRTHVDTIANILVKFLGGYTRELTTTVSGKKIHFYDCEALQGVLTTRKRTWEQCSHCQKLEYERIEQAAEELYELACARRDYVKVLEANARARRARGRTEREEARRAA